VNHQSVLDIIALTYIWPKNTTVMAKKEIRYIPFFGLAFWLGGGKYINRSDAKESWSLLQKISSLIKSDNVSLIMFPEGTRNTGNTTCLPFKKGAFSIAVNTGLPIVPIVISPLKQVDLTAFSPKPILIKFLDPIDTSQLGNENKDINLLKRQCRDAIMAGIDELDDILSHTPT
jgi:1-acyl-sn-glycerol-3-phosphate acyltransferase